MKDEINKEYVQVAFSLRSFWETSFNLFVCGQLCQVSYTCGSCHL